MSGLWWPPFPGGLTAHGSSAAMDQTTGPQKEAGDTKPLQLMSGASPPSRIHKTAGSQKQGRCRSSPGKTKTSHTCVTFLRKSSGSPEGPVLVTLRAETHGHPGTCSAPSPSGDLTPRVAVREILLGSRLNSQGLRGVPLLTPNRSLLLQRAMSTARLEGGSQVPEHQAEGGEEPVR